MLKVIPYVSAVAVGVGTISDISMHNKYSNDTDNPNYVSGGKIGLNLGISIYGLWAPHVSALYFGVDLFYPGGRKGYLNDWHNAVNPNNDPQIDRDIMIHSAFP